METSCKNGNAPRISSADFDCSANPHDGPNESETEKMPLQKDSVKNRIKSGKGNKLATKSVVVVTAANSLEGCDEQLLPSSFRVLETDLKFSPSILGNITLIQMLCMSLFSPLWGVLSDLQSRKWILVFGSTLWGLCTIALAFVHEIWHVMILRALNGLALGSVSPVSQSIIASSISESRRGTAFGLIQMASCLGKLIGGAVTVSISAVEFGSLKGWRICFMAVGIASIIFSIIAAIILEDKPSQTKNRKICRISDTGAADQTTSYENVPTLVSIFSELRLSFLTPSVAICVCESALGLIPWSALSFIPMFFQYCGLTDTETGILMGTMLVAAAIGGLGGGYLGDLAFRISPNHGRPLIGQLAMIVRVPILIVAYIYIPKEPASFYYFLIICVLLGLVTMSGVVVNRPILADIVFPHLRATVFSIIVAVEGTAAAIFGAPLVGYLSEYVFGYIETDLKISELTHDSRLNNATALAWSLLYVGAIPWFLSFLLYGLLHFSLGDDRELMKKKLDELYVDADVVEPIDE